MRLPFNQVPRLGLGNGCFAEFSERLEAKFGVRVEEMPLDQVPPPDHEPWIAAVSDDHVCAVIGLTRLNEIGEAINVSTLHAAYRVVPA